MSHNNAVQRIETLTPRDITFIKQRYDAILGHSKENLSLSNPDIYVIDCNQSSYNQPEPFLKQVLLGSQALLGCHTRKTHKKVFSSKSNFEMTRDDLIPKFIIDIEALLSQFEN